MEDAGGCSCTLQVRSGSAGQCYAPSGVRPSEWTHVTTEGDADAAWFTNRRSEGQFKVTGKGRMTMSYLHLGERVQCDTVTVTRTPWQSFVSIITDPRVLIGAGIGAACALGGTCGL